MDVRAATSGSPDCETEFAVEVVPDCILKCLRPCQPEIVVRSPGRRKEVASACHIEVDRGISGPEQWRETLQDLELR